MAEKFPDFASCDSLSEDSDTNNFVGFQTPGRRKKGKKHKLSPSPNKDYFLKVPSKRPNTACSPDKTI